MKNKSTLGANAAKKLLQANWGIKADLSALPSERDVNFKAVGDKTYVLKIYLMGIMKLESILLMFLFI